MMSTEQTPQLHPQEISGFKIWYSESVYSSNDGMWNDAPQDDVQVVMIYFKYRDALGRHTRLYSSGCDYYALDTDGKFTSSFDDPSKVKGHILHGRFMNWEVLSGIEKMAFLDYGEELVDKEIADLVR